MAIPKIKATYSLDVDTVEKLALLAQRWGVSKSEALRRVIGLAADAPGDPDHEALAALDQLQSAAALTASDVREWQKAAKAERLAARSGER